MKKVIMGMLLSTFLVGCNDDNDNLQMQIDEHGLTGDPVGAREVPSVDDPKVKLGKALFYSTDLGGEYDTACASCHHPMLGGGDALNLPVGVGAVDKDGNMAQNLLGPGRFSSETGAFPNVPRNAPTTFNVFLWDQTLFWDGRIYARTPEEGLSGKSSLIVTPDSAGFDQADLSIPSGVSLSQAQARFPVTSAAEQRGHFIQGKQNGLIRHGLATRLQSMGTWDALFTAAYGDSEITFNRIVEAIGEFENSQVFVNNPWRQYLEGDDGAISASAKSGAALVLSRVDDGGAGCIACHSGDFFSDEQLHAVAFPQLGEGKGDDSGSGANDDFGFERVTGDPSHRYHFRTPSLLNVSVTGPWGHAGAFEHLNDLVRYHADPINQFEQYFGISETDDFDSTSAYCMLGQVMQVQEYDGVMCREVFSSAYANTSRAVAMLSLGDGVSAQSEFRALSDQEVDNIVDFLHTLTDPCVLDRACLSPWIIEQGSDEHRVDSLIGIDEQGDLL